MVDVLLESCKSLSNTMISSALGFCSNASLIARKLKIAIVIPVLSSLALSDHRLCHASIPEIQALACPAGLTLGLQPGELTCQFRRYKRWPALQAWFWVRNLVNLPVNSGDTSVGLPCRPGSRFATWWTYLSIPEIQVLAWPAGLALGLQPGEVTC